MSEAPILDQPYIARRRIKCGLSRRALARRLGVSTSTIVTLETKRELGGFSLRFVVRLAEVLGTTPARLLRPEQGPTSVIGQADDVKLEAALVRAGRSMHRDDLARGFGWSPERVIRGLEALGRRLEGTGQCLSPTSWGWFLLRERGDVWSDFEEAAITRAMFAEYGMKPGPARQLATAVRDWQSGVRRPQSWQSNLSENRRRQRGVLLSAGLVRVDNGGVFLPSDDLLFSLGLVEERGEPSAIPSLRRRRRARGDRLVRSKGD